MLARGFTGRVRALRPSRPGAADAGFALATAVYLAGMLLWVWR